MEIVGIQADAFPILMCSRCLSILIVSFLAVCARFAACCCRIWLSKAVLLFIVAFGHGW